MKIVIGLAGQKNAGKGTFIELLQQNLSDKVIKSVKSSAILGETLEIWGISFTVENLQKLANVMVDGYGDGILTNAVKKRIDDIDADIVIFDGVRWMTDVMMIRSYANNALVYVTADAHIRYNRSVVRNEKVGDSVKTFDKFMEEEQASTEQMLLTIGKMADFQIANDYSLKEFREKVNIVCSLFMTSH